MFWHKTPRWPVNMLPTPYFSANKHHIPSPKLPRYRPHPNQQTSHRHQHYHDTVHTPINKPHIPPSPTLPWYRPQQNQQISHPTVTNPTTIPSTPQSTNITSPPWPTLPWYRHTPINKHHIPPSPTLPWYRPHQNQQTSHPTITNTTMIPSTPQSTNITSHRHQHYHDTVHTPSNKHHIPPSPTLPQYRPHTNLSCVPLSNQHLFTVPLLSYADTHSASLLEMPSH